MEKCERQEKGLDGGILKEGRGERGKEERRKEKEREGEKEGGKKRGKGKGKRLF